jgi:hypothetical protein
LKMPPTNPLTEEYIVSTRVQDFEDLCDLMLAVDRECSNCYNNFYLHLGVTVGYCDYEVIGIGVEAYERTYNIYKAMLKQNSSLRERHIIYRVNRNTTI